MPTKVIIDCDPGNGVPATDVDDALALGLALASPELDLTAVTIVDGNTPRDTGFACARTLLEAAGSPGIGVHTGAAHALLEPLAPWADRRARKRDSPEASTLWEGVPGPDAHDPGHRHDAAAEIAARVAAAPGEVTLVAIGPLTNIAHALAVHPGLARDVARIVIMGGAFDVPGYLQELNFGMDPEAARVVLASGAPITLVPLDVTATTSLRLPDLDRLAGRGGPLVDYLCRTTAPWIRYSEQVRGNDGCRLHDPLAVALLLDPDLVETEERVVDVQVDGLTRSRPIGWRPGSLVLHAGLDVPDRAPVRVVTGVDNARLVDLVVDTLTRS
ncbi:nucleoside hydrolase [Pseudonocardia nematodicida]|uniref:Nucleoside hydrolase n=1 Tax=Pseudonocardia nematodicida TaxID=1206997 RepID=A0ABV1KD05_9PSEU